MISNVTPHFKYQSWFRMQHLISNARVGFKCHRLVGDFKYWSLFQMQHLISNVSADFKCHSWFRMSNEHLPHHERVRHLVEQVVEPLEECHVTSWQLAPEGGRVTGGCHTSGIVYVLSDAMWQCFVLVIHNSWVFVVLSKEHRFCQPIDCAGVPQVHHSPSSHIGRVESPVPDDGESQHVWSEHVAALADEQVIEGYVKVGGPGGGGHGQTVGGVFPFFVFTGHWILTLAALWVPCCPINRRRRQSRRWMGCWILCRYTQYM